jgi:hypothetical protein
MRYSCHISHQLLAVVQHLLCIRCCSLTPFYWTSYTVSGGAICTCSLHHTCIAYPHPGIFPVSILLHHGAVGVASSSCTAGSVAHTQLLPGVRASTRSARASMRPHMCACLVTAAPHFASTTIAGDTNHTCQSLLCAGHA